MFVNVAFFAGFTWLVHVEYIVRLCELLWLVLLWNLDLYCER